MKYYELVIIKGYIDTVGTEEYEFDVIEDVETKLFSSKEERDLKYDRLVEPYRKIYNFCNETKEKLFHGENAPDPRDYAAVDATWDRLHKMQRDFIAKSEIKNLDWVYVSENADSARIDVELKIPDDIPCNNCEKAYEDGCEGCDFSVRPYYFKFYKIFKKEVEV